MKNNKLDKAFPLTSESFHGKILETLEALPESENDIECKRRDYIMKNKFGFKKTLTAAIAAVLLLTGAAFAIGSGVASYSVSWSSTAYNFDKMPDDKTCEKKFGYIPKRVEAFENGYTFEGANTVTNQLYYDDGSKGEKTKSLSIDYIKDGKEVRFNTEKAFAEQDNPRGNFSRGDEMTPYEVYGGIELYTYDHILKLVPEDYKMTEEDIALEAEGNVSFSSVGNGNFENGMEIGEEVSVKLVGWVDGEISYSLSVFGINKISTEELIEMAHEIIDCE